MPALLNSGRVSMLATSYVPVGLFEGPNSPLQKSRFPQDEFFNTESYRRLKTTCRRQFEQTVKIHSTHQAVIPDDIPFHSSALKLQKPLANRLDFVIFRTQNLNYL